MIRPAGSELRLYLKRLTARSTLSDVELSALSALPTIRQELPAKFDIVHVDQETSHSCLVVAGLVARFGQLRNGARQTTAFHIPGDMADLHSAVRPMGIGGLQTLSPSVILRIPHDAIQALAARFPAVGQALWRDCMLDTAVLMEWVVNIGRRDAASRLAHLFCELAIRYGNEPQPPLEFRFPVTQEQLAEAVGMTGVHVNRVLGTLRNARLVTFLNRTVRIHDWRALVAFGDFDAAYLLADTRFAPRKGSPTRNNSQSTQPLAG